MIAIGSKGACILAWGLAILIPVVLVAGVGWPWLERRGELDRKVAADQDQLQRYRRLIATLPGLKAELERTRNNQDVKTLYYDAPTPQLAGAQLQREVQDMVREAGAQLVSTQVLPANEDEQPPRVSVRTQIRGETEALLDVLYRIEHARPFLFVDQLSVRTSARRATPRRSPVRGRASAARRRPDTALTVRLDIFGYAPDRAR